MMHARASVSAWFQLCDLLDGWGDFGRLEHEIIPYLEGHLSRWPDNLRVVPDRWVDAWFDESLGGVARLMRRLFLGSKLRGPDGLEPLLGVRANQHITQLDIGWNGLGAEEVAALIGSSFFGALTHLVARGNPMGDAGASALADSDAMREICVLDLGFCGISGAGAAVLGEETFANLRSLDLGRNRLGVVGARNLASAPFVANLEQLHLHECQIRDVGVEALCRALEGGGRLEVLNLNDNQVGDMAVERMVEGRCLEGIRELELARNGLTDVAVRVLVSSPVVAQLSALNLNGNAITLDGVRAIASSPNLRSLERLTLPELGPWAGKLLGASETLPKALRERYS